jgi:hypothetical protein
MLDHSAAQNILLRGWASNRDSVNCLTHYFWNIEDLKVLRNELATEYSKVDSERREAFLEVITAIYNYHQELKEEIKAMAYEIISSRIPQNPSIVSKLKIFNENDKELVKDTIRFSLRASEKRGKSQG